MSLDIKRAWYRLLIVIGVWCAVLMPVYIIGVWYGNLIDSWFKELLVALTVMCVVSIAYDWVRGGFKDKDADNT